MDFLIMCAAYGIGSFLVGCLFTGVTLGMSALFIAVTGSDEE